MNCDHPRYVRQREKAAAKVAGKAAASEWARAAPAGSIGALLAIDFPYGSTLDQVNRSVSVPASADVDFSWGFYKQIRFISRARARAKHKLRAWNPMDAHRRRVE